MVLCQTCQATDVGPPSVCFRSLQNRRNRLCAPLVRTMCVKQHEILFLEKAIDEMCEVQFRPLAALSTYKVRPHCSGQRFATLVETVLLSHLIIKAFPAHEAGSLHQIQC